MKIVVIGAAGQMTSVTAKGLIPSLGDANFLLTDLHLDALKREYGQLESSRIKLAALDLNATAALNEAIKGADLVINGAGPFHVNAPKVRGACLAGRANYLDIDDDVESCLSGIEMNDAAKAAGVGLFLGCGASPGFTNVLAADAMKGLDRVDTLEVAWLAGDEGDQELGTAVLEHTLHIGAGDCLTWRDGRRQMTESFAATATFDFGGEVGNYRVYETAHPEPIMFGHSIPSLKDARCWGGLHPQPVNGLIRGVAVAARNGQLTKQEAVTFLQKTIAGKSASLKGWRYAMKGIFGQVARGENTFTNVLQFFFDEMRGKKNVNRSGIVALATGELRGKPHSILRRVPVSPSNPFWSKMAVCTGMTAAAMAKIVLLSKSPPTGTVFPERLTTLQEVVATLESMGFKESDLVLKSQ
jgi:saccharopine dehydrogenase-like NADP-dependent oxidoreductase